MPEKNTQSNSTDQKPSNSIITQVAERINDSENVLVALSKNPSVDELSAALGLTFILDKLGKHATAIFSGAVPNAIEFLEPEKTFESNTNSLQDFIIALNKDKADHLRYKIEGDFVKVFITPYRTTINEKDLEFSHGDYNVDLIIALNVDAEADLDSALSEYGKIKHDASSINIAAAAPGKFGDLEWGNPAASSVSEMIADLADILDDDGEEKLVDKATATALLAGIVAATNRFSNERTTPDTMSIASELMTDGADQQLISSSIPVDILTRDVADVNEEVAEEINRKPEKEEKKVEEEPQVAPVPEEPKKDPTELIIDREEEASAKKPDNVPDLPSPEPSPIEPADETPTTQDEASVIETTAVPAPAEAEPIDAPTPELEPLAEPAPKPASIPAPIEASIEAPVVEETPAETSAQVIPDVPEQIVEPNPHPDSATISNDKTLTPPSEEDMPPKANIDYEAEMEQALQEPALPANPMDLPTAELPSLEAPVAPEPEAYAPDNAIPVVNNPVANESVETPIAPPTTEFQPVTDPAQPPIPPMGIAPTEAEYIKPPLPLPTDGEVLPPPPVPFDLDGNPLPPTATPTATPMATMPVNPIQSAPTPSVDMPVAAPSAQEFVSNVQDEVQAAAQIPTEPIMPAVLQEETLDAATSPSVNGVNPVMQDQVYNDPSAFQIPGM